MIECTDLIKIYSDEQTNTRVAALRGIDLNIKKGELVSIVGPSGSGKTTLIKIIAGIESISSGKIIVDGLELNKLTSNELLNYRLRTIGMVQQFPEKTLFLSGTVFDNLTFASSLHSKNYEKNKEQNQQLMEMLGISHLAHRKVNTLSGGELIRTSIACALAKKTKVILCDEPTGQLDSANTEIVKNILRKITYDFKTTVLVVTHDLRFLKDVDRTCEIHSGRVSSLYSGDSFEETTSDDFPLGFLAQVDSTQSVRIPDKVYKFLKLNDNVRFFINKDSSVVLKHPEGIPPQTIDISKHKKKQRLSFMDLPKNYFSKKTIEIQLNDVSKVYDERKLKIPALSSVNLKFFTNELAFIIGPSGSGKSTFIKLITGLESVTSGELIVRNNSLNELDDGLRADFRMKNFGIVSQQGDLHPTMTITRNLFLKQIFSGHRISDSYFTQENIESILNEFQITHRKDSYPLEISGGELQRASLAVALFDNPQILVLDEPTANMDAELASEVMSNIYDLHSKTEKMILITTHDFSLVRDNTRIIELTDGKVTHDGLAIIKEE